MNKPDDTLALQCQVELTDSNESDDRGCTLTLRVPDSESLGRLKKALAGNAREPQYLLHLLKMDKGKAAIDPARRSRLENTLKIEPLSRNALTLARDPDFWRYLEQIDLAAVDGEIDEVHAKQYIYRTCVVTSPQMLDRDNAAASLYRSLIIRPFLAWLQGR
jgi:hypothetical protein